MQKYDIIVIGGGPGGYVAAIRAAQLGAKVALIEKDKVGGTCLNRGCIPTKAIIACLNLYDKVKKASSFGIKLQNPFVDLKAIIERKNSIVEKIIKGVELLLKKNQIEVIYGVGKVIDPRKVDIVSPTGDRRQVTGDKLILATGSSPAPFPGIEFDGNKFFSSDQALNLTEIPERINIVGGGVIGMEFTHIFSSLGSEVTVYETLPEILTGVDDEVITQLKRILRRKKVNILTNTKFDISKAAEKNLICVGRKPNLPEGINIEVNDRMETKTKGVYAVGDLVSPKMLAHVAYEQGVIAAENAMGGKRKFDYNNVPIGIYTNPEIAAIGLSEKAAREKHKDIKIGKFPFAALGIANAAGEIEGFIKVISDKKGKLLGVHIIGPEANNLIGCAAIAMKNGVTVEKLAETFQAHPSYPEGLQEAALALLGRGIHSIS